jgi:hypothetical protein
MDNDRCTRTTTTTLPASVDGGRPWTTSGAWCGGWAICNVAFLAVICWLTAGRRDQPWWMGLVWSAGYQVIWFVAAHIGAMMIQRISNIDPRVPEQEEQEAMLDEKTSGDTAHDDKISNKNKINKPTRLALLYGLVVTLFLAVVGWQLPRHVIHSPSTSTDRDYYYNYD